MDDQSNNESWGKFSDATEADLSEYRVLSGLAVVGFLLSLLSALTLVHVTLSFIAGAAILCCIIALVRISASPSEMSGRKLAVAGLAIAVFWMAMGLARHTVNHHLMDIHSRDFAARWFEYLKNDEPEKACELGTPILGRQPLDDKLMDTFLASQDRYEGLQTFVNSAEVRALLALGERAQVRHYVFDGADSREVRQTFAVTYDDAGVKKSFLMRMVLVRNKLPDRGITAWQTGHTRAPWVPGT